METSVSAVKGDFSDAMNLLPSVLLLTLALPSFAEPIELTNTSGKSIRAEIIAHDAATNSIRYKRLRDGRVFTSSVNLFNQPTQERLKSKSSGESQNSAVSVTARQKLVYDHARELWKETAPKDGHSGRNDIFRSVFALKNDNSEDLTNLKVDIVIQIGAEGKTEETRVEQQTFSIIRIRSGEAIQVQSKRYEISSEKSEDEQKEIVRGTALRLRDSNSGEIIFTWQSASLENTPILWQEPNNPAQGLTAMLR